MLRFSSQKRKKKERRADVIICRRYRYSQLADILLLCISSLLFPFYPTGYNSDESHEEEETNEKSPSQSQLICPSPALKAFPCCCHRRCPLCVSALLPARGFLLFGKKRRRRGRKKILLELLFGPRLLFGCIMEKKKNPPPLSVITSQSVKGKKKKGIRKRRVEHLLHLCFFLSSSSFS